MVDASILNSEWVEPKDNGEWGFKLKEGAPADVVKAFEQYEKNLGIVNTGNQ